MDTKSSWGLELYTAPREVAAFAILDGGVVLGLHAGRIMRIDKDDPQLEALLQVPEKP